ncbi:MAG: hypothetical protein KDK66_08995, partial [Deltaproteobacteria bacterium]|nr:hypothetical protein [Deltaproteobacteria bacterium]
ENLGKLEHLIEFKKFNLSFGDLLKSFNVPRDWALLERSLLLLMGLTQHLAPQYNPLETILPYAQNFALGSQGTVGDFLVETLKEAILSYVKLPAELQKTLKSLKKGELKLGHPQAIEEQRLLRKAINQLSYVLLALGLWYMSENTSSLGAWQESLRYVSIGFGLLFIINFFRKG